MIDSGINKVAELDDAMNSVKSFQLCLPENISVHHHERGGDEGKSKYKDRLDDRHLLMINQGAAVRLLMDGISYSLSPGHAIIIKRFQHYSFQSQDNTPADCLAIAFQTRNEIELNHFANALIPLGKAEDELIRDFLDSYAHVRKTNETHDRDFLILKFAQILMTLRNTHFSNHPDLTEELNDSSRNQAHQRFLNSLNQFLDENLEEGVGIDQIAHHLSLSPVHLRRKFKAITDENLGKFLKRYKLQIAMRLLTNTDMSQVEIATASGYQSLSSLNRIFKDQFGMSPNHYKKDYLARLKQERVTQK
ncbi:MAG: AraC family transcriptional regulator [Verrucomicrobiota bacterium]